MDDNELTTSLTKADMIVEVYKITEDFIEDELHSRLFEFYKNKEETCGDEIEINTFHTVGKIINSIISTTKDAITTDSEKARNHFMMLYNMKKDRLSRKESLS